MGKKIALLGSAPSSLRLAPFSDLSWCLWSCSPGVYPTVQQGRPNPIDGDAHFELHRPEPPVIGDPARQVQWFSPEYWQWMKQFKGPVFTADIIPDFPTSVRYPREKMIDIFGPYFFSSSLAWMMAAALETPGIEEIGLWGVDMAANEEWQHQRPGCHFFITEAARRGIRITVPPESDLLQPYGFYGIDESLPMAIKMTARTNELRSRLNLAQQQLAQAQQAVHFLGGAIENQEYVYKTWVSSAEVERAIARLSQPRADVIPIKAGTVPGD